MDKKFQPYQGNKRRQSISIETEILTAAKKQADIETRSLSNLIEFLLKQYLKTNKWKI